MKNNAFTHTLSEEKIREFINSSSESRLKWLEEAQEFVRKNVDPKIIERWQKLQNKR